MNDDEFDFDDFSDEEILELIDQVDQNYQEWNINLDSMINKLSENKKLFLNELYNHAGEKVFYIIYGYLNSDSLIEYNELSNNGLSEFINELNDTDTLSFVELLIEFSKFELEISEEQVDFAKVISKLKRDVATLKKKISQPSKFINTKQFEERFSLSPLQQKSLRSRLNDPLPFSVVNNRILYEPELIEKWMENFKVN